MLKICSTELIFGLREAAFERDVHCNCDLPKVAPLYINDHVSFPLGNCHIKNIFVTGQCGVVYFNSQTMLTLDLLTHFFPWVSGNADLLESIYMYFLMEMTET